MKNIKFCVLAMLALPLTGCFSNQQLLSESDQYVGEWILEGGLVFQVSLSANQV